jgi:hypothetical protein
MSFAQTVLLDFAKALCGQVETALPQITNVSTGVLRLAARQISPQILPVFQPGRIIKR